MDTPKLNLYRVPGMKVVCGSGRPHDFFLVARTPSEAIRVYLDLRQTVQEPKSVLFECAIDAIAPGVLEPMAVQRPAGILTQ